MGTAPARRTFESIDMHYSMARTDMADRLDPELYVGCIVPYESSSNSRSGRVEGRNWMVLGGAILTK